MSSIGKDKENMLKRLTEVSYYLAVNGCPYMYFHGKVSKLHVEILYKTPLSVCFRKIWKS